LQPRVLSEKLATTLLALFLILVLLALGVTLSSVATSIKVLAAGAVTPIVALSLLFIIFQLRRRPWAFAGAALLGALGVVLRLVINTQPQLEVGGGLPLWVTATYVATGVAVLLTNLWAYLSLTRPRFESPGAPPPRPTPPS
jgi:hypothetical protein